MRVVRPTALTWVAAASAVLVVIATVAYLLVDYANLPDLLAVHFSERRRPNGWQYKTYARVLTPVFIQAALGCVSAAIAALLLSRTHEPDEAAPDVHAARIAAETVVLFGTIWVLFQSYASVALMAVWRAQRTDLGVGYTAVALGGIVLTIVVAARAHALIGSPGPRPFVAGHWRLRHLYNNPDDAALFVPTRDGGRWTLNFGRPVAAILVAITLALGIIVPTVILRLALR